MLIKIGSYLPGRYLGGLWLLLLLSGCGVVDAVLLNSYETTELKVEGVTLHMTGIINAKTPAQLADVLESNPQLVRIEFGEVPGSVDDTANLQAARMVRAAELDTHLNATSMVASGGTDFFLAGVNRSIDAGAEVGVHSWGAGFGIEGRDFPRNDPEHLPYLEYYKEMSIPVEFYWFTLEVAGPDDIHWMTNEELERYDFISKSVE